MTTAPRHLPVRDCMAAAASLKSSSGAVVDQFVDQWCTWPYLPEVRLIHVDGTDGPMYYRWTLNCHCDHECVYSAVTGTAGALSQAKGMDGGATHKILWVLRWHPGTQ